MTEVYGSFMNVTTFTEATVKMESQNNMTSPKNTCRMEGLWLMRVIFQVLLSLPVEVVGIVGNLVAFVVLFRQRPVTTTTVLLQFMAVADVLVLLLSLLLTALRMLHVCFIQDGVYLKAAPYMVVYVFPFVYVARFCTTWLTVLMTVDRFIAVCRPLHAQRLCTLSRVYKEVAILLVIAFIYSVPRFFEYRLEDNFFGYATTTLMRNKTYTVAYKLILFFLVMYLVPIAVLSVLNILLVQTLRKAEAARDQMRMQNRDVSYKRDVTVVVAIVVLVFILCNLPSMIAHLLLSLHTSFEWLKNLETPRQYLSNLGNFLVTLNSAINFVIYCMFSKNFRKTLRRLCCKRYHHQRRVSQGSTKTGSVYLSLQSTNGKFAQNLMAD